MNYLRLIITGWKFLYVMLMESKSNCLRDTQRVIMFYAPDAFAHANGLANIIVVIMDMIASLTRTCYICSIQPLEKHSRNRVLGSCSSRVSLSTACMKFRIEPDFISFAGR